MQFVLANLFQFCVISYNINYAYIHVLLASMQLIAAQHLCAAGDRCMISLNKRLMCVKGRPPKVLLSLSVV